MTMKQHAGRAAAPDSPSHADLHGRITDKIIAGQFTTANLSGLRGPLHSVVP